MASTILRPGHIDFCLGHQMGLERINYGKCDCQRSGRQRDQSSEWRCGTAAFASRYSWRLSCLGASGFVEQDNDLQPADVKLVLFEGGNETTFDVVTSGSDRSPLSSPGYVSPQSPTSLKVLVVSACGLVAIPLFLILAIALGIALGTRPTSQ